MRRMRRREFLSRLSVAMGIPLAAGSLGCRKRKLGNVTGPMEARFYSPCPDGMVQCRLCFRGCVIPKDQPGLCRNRRNREGRLLALTYGRPCTVMVDPVEKEPAHHLLPGTRIFCVASAGCNSRCRHCQNWTISQMNVEDVSDLGYSPEQIVEEAIARRCPTVSFTYSDPIAFFEYMVDICDRAKQKGLLTLCHTNGTLREEPLKKLLSVLDAVTVDLKGFTENFYRTITSMSLAPVLESLKLIRKVGRHLEIVNLVIPTWNDDPADIRAMCRWIANELGPDVPLHFNRYFPAYRLKNLPPTPIQTLEHAYTIAREERLDYVYLGNVPGHQYNSTFCPRCNSLLVNRVHFFSTASHLKDGACNQCGHTIPGIWKV